MHLRLFAVELAAALADPSADTAALEMLLDSWDATAELDASPELRQTVDEYRAGEFEPAYEWLKTRRTA